MGELKHVIALALCALLVAPTPARAETLVIFGDDIYPPVAYREGDADKGILIDLLRLIERETGDRYEFRLTPWKRAYESASRGEGGVMGVSRTSAREAVFDFSQPIYDDDIQIVVTKGREFPFAALDDLKGKTIGGVQGASYGQDVDAAIAARLFTVERDTGQVARLRKLLAGRLDAAFVGNGQYGLEWSLAQDPTLKQNKSVFAVLPKPLQKDPLHVAFAKSLGKADALRRIDEAIAKAKQNGDYRRIVERAGAGS